MASPRWAKLFYMEELPEKAELIAINLRMALGEDDRH